ncbi:MAG TPA: pirin-like C-terminal cupin domain-containing protein, partial [Burkholderiaceae bacterium]
VARPGVQASVVLGEALGARSPVETSSPMFLVDVRLEPGARIELDVAHAERGAYVIEGEVHDESNPGATVPKEHLVVFEPGEPAVLVAGAAAPAHVTFLGGPPLDAPRFLWWNFVSSSRDRVLEAQAAWSRQEFPPVPGETEYIPLPSSRPLPPAGSAL